MRPISPAAFAPLLDGAVLCACDSSTAVSPRREPPPVVRVLPVQSHPFGDEYAVGLTSGKTAGRPRTEAVEALTLQEAGADPKRAAKWQRGWVSGYMDGFCKSSGGVK